ncbi:MAG TPA: hypothetical protein VJ577_01300 [Burkholderiaceae bacterium]|nr:hypothetical protein [Burkholderiaceae bacterium]
MRLTYNSVYKWLEEEAKNPTHTQVELEKLESRLLEAIMKAHDRSVASKEALAKAEAAAKAAGFDSLADLLEQTQPALGGLGKIKSASGSELAPPRKPYLDPLDPDTQAYAVYRNRPVPEAIQRRLDEGWTLEEMHFKRIREGRLRRQLRENHPYDPIEKHKQLMATAERKPRRNPPPKK